MVKCSGSPATRLYNPLGGPHYRLQVHAAVQGQSAASAVGDVLLVYCVL